MNWVFKSLVKRKPKKRSRKKRKNKRKRRTSNESISTGKTQKSIAKRRRKSRNITKGKSPKKTNEGEIVQDLYKNTGKDDIRLQRVILIDFYVYFTLKRSEKNVKNIDITFFWKNSSFLFRPDFLFLAFLILLLHDKFLGLALKLFGRQQFIILFIIFKVLEGEHSTLERRWLCVWSDHVGVWQILVSVNNLSGLVLDHCQEHQEVSLWYGLWAANLLCQLPVAFDSLENSLN